MIGRTAIAQLVGRVGVSSEQRRAGDARRGLSLVRSDHAMTLHRWPRSVTPGPATCPGRLGEQRPNAPPTSSERAYALDVSFPERASTAVAPERGPAPLVARVGVEDAEEPRPGWMRSLAEHYERTRQGHPTDELCVVFDIDGTILDLRHLVVGRVARLRP